MRNRQPAHEEGIIYLLWEPAATGEAVLFLLESLSVLLDSGFQGGYGPQRKSGPMARQNLCHHHRGAAPY